MNNLDIWSKVRVVPDTAIKSITGGRLKGMSDINPVWRLKTLTEQFGVCGFGWKYEITDKRLEHGAKDEIAAFVDINLYIKIEDKWSDAIPGTGGSSFVTLEKTNGLYTSDECFKMALTDALSVACKSLGVGADVYWSKDNAKYNNQSTNSNQQPKEQPLNKPNNKPAEVINIDDKPIDKVKQVTLLTMIKKSGTNEAAMFKFYKVDKIEDIKTSLFMEIMNTLERKIKKNGEKQILEGVI